MCIRDRCCCGCGRTRRTPTGTWCSTRSAGPSSGWTASGRRAGGCRRSRGSSSRAGTAWPAARTRRTNSTCDGWSSSGRCARRTARTCCTPSGPAPGSGPCCCRTTPCARRSRPRCRAGAGPCSRTARSPCCAQTGTSPGTPTRSSGGPRRTSPTPTPPPCVPAPARSPGSATRTSYAASPTVCPWPGWSPTASRRARATGRWWRPACGPPTSTTGSPSRNSARWPSRWTRSGAPPTRCWASSRPCGS